MTTITNITAIIVTCEDGKVRHQGTFAERHEAEVWANWGHCCTSDHTFRQASQAEQAITAKRQEATP